MNELEEFLKEKGVILPENILNDLNEYFEDRISQEWQDGYNEGYDFGYEAGQE